MKKLLAFAALFIVDGLARADEPKKEPSKVPFELLKSGHMAVQVKVNGKGPYRLVFDTGAPMMLMTSRLAKEAGVVGKGASGGLFNVMPEPVPIKKFEMGTLNADDVKTVVMDHPTVSAMEKILGRIDGIVGFPFFARYRMTIDYQAKEMTFDPVDFKPTNVMESLQKQLMKMLDDPKAGAGPTILAPAAVWGLVADKGTQDDDPGIDLRTVLKDGAADKAGLKPGDRLLTLDGRWTDTVVDLYEAVSHVKPGKTVPLKIKRHGKEMTMQVTPTAGL